MFPSKSLLFSRTLMSSSLLIKDSIGENVLLGIDKAIDLAEENFQGLVIGNQAASFSVGANLAMILMAAAEQEYDQINSSIKKYYLYLF